MQEIIADLFSAINKNKPDIDTALLEKAIRFSVKAHRDQKRRSGEPFWIHPANVALILAELNTDIQTIIAALLHDIIEDTEYSYRDVENEFGTETADLVEGVSKLEKYEYRTNISRKSQQSENFRKLIISITRDIRVILIKLADRLHNMRTIEFLSQEQIERISRETIDIYAPLANRFGLAKIKWELEDISFKYLFPEEYRKIKEVIDQKKEERDKYIDDMIEPVRKLLETAGIDAEVSGRSKHFYSIYRKKQKKKGDYEDIYDLAALRIIVNSIEDCYETLGIIHTEFEPIDQRFRDYISRPKPNNYQSLHTAVFGNSDRKVEFQIRTGKMHLIAEEGIAAHWHYKEKQDRESHTELLQEDVRNSFRKQINWLRNILQQDKESSEFIDVLKMNLYSDIIVVSTPDGDYIELPKHSTPIDFAFAVHTEVGFHCIGAKVNGKFVPIRSLLHTGDVVEVQTSPSGHPSKDWLSFMKSTKARSKVRSYFRQKELEDALQLGEDIFLKNCRRIHYKLKDEESILKIAGRFKINNLKTFFAQIGKGDILFSQIKEIIAEDKSEESNLPERIEPETSEFSERKVVKGVKIGGIDNLMINYAKCCNPLPGDKIIAYTTRGRGISIHRKDCSNPGFIHLMRKEPERIMSVNWDYSLKKKRTKKGYIKKIKVTGVQNPNFLLKILGKFSKCSLELDDMDLQKKRRQAVGIFSFYIDNEKEFQILRNELLELRGVFKVEEQI